MYSLPCSGTLVVLWGGNGHSETVDKQTDGQRDSPWHCPQSTVLGNNSPLFMGLWQKRSRLRASIPDTFPLFPPSFLHILHPPSQFPCPPTLLSPFSLSLHNFLPLFWEQEEQKSRLPVTGTVLLWSRGKKKKKKNWGIVQGGSDKGSSVLLLSGVRQGKETERHGDRWMGRLCAAVSGVLYCWSTGCLINQWVLSLYSAAVFD